MELKNARIIDVEGWNVIIADRPQAVLLNYYSGLSQVQGDWREIAIVCATAERAQKILKTKSDAEIGMAFTTARSQAFPGVAKALKGRGVIYERNVDVDDDSGIKETYPPPDGIEVRFRWSPKELVHRVDAFTEKNGVIVTRTAVLSPGPRAFEDDLKKAYARFLRTCPAPRGERAMKCGAHLAHVIARLDAPAAAQFHKWMEGLKARSIHDRGNHPNFEITGLAIDPNLQAVTIMGVRGKNEIEGCLRYSNGHQAHRTTMTLRTDIPETIIAALGGRTVSDAIDARELSHARFVRHLQTRPAGKEPTSHDFKIEFPMVTVPIPEGAKGDDDAALRRLRRNYADYTMDQALRGTFMAMPPTWMLHILRTLRVKTDHALVMDFVPWAEVSEVRLEKKNVVIARNTTGSIGDILGEPKALAA